MAVEFKSDCKRTSEYRFYPEDIQIKPELNGRHDKPDIEWLIVDILKIGQHTPVVIRNDGGKAVLCAGFSRWRAIGEINKRKLLPVKMQVRCTYTRSSESEAFLINISENRFRNPTTPVDDAHNIKRMLNNYAMTEEQIAEIYFPTAKTPSELKAAKKFVKDRISLISLTPEAEKAVTSGRIKESAAVAISKLSESQQREALKGEGKVKLPKKARTPKPTVADAELRRRVAVMLEDVAVADINDASLKYLEIDRVFVLAIHEYLNA